MNCIKCGSKISEGQVFCDECLQDMERHPVKPGTPVILPNRPAAVAAKRRHARKARKPEEQIHTLKNIIMWLMLALAVTMLLLSLSVSMLVQLQQSKGQNFLPGQNYSTIDSGADAT